MANSKPTASSVDPKIVLNQAAPYLGEWVNFTAIYPGTVKNPRIVVNCYQNETTLVWGEVGLVTDDVARACQQAVEAGATLLTEPAVKPWGQTIAYVRCPDGTLVELCTAVEPR